MDAQQFVNDEMTPGAFDQEVQRVSGAAPPDQGQGAPPYPLYGVPSMGANDQVAKATAPVATRPIYKRPWFTFLAGAALVGAAWTFFDVVRPRMKKNAAKKKSEKGED